MNFFRKLRPLVVMTLLFLSSIAIHAQQGEPSYDVALQLVVGSNETGERADLPADLAIVGRQLKSRFNFGSYKLSSTLMGRVASGGNFEYKSVANAFGKETPGAQTFLDWSLVRLKNQPTTKGQPGFWAEAFRFGARVPVTTAQHEDSGKTFPVINYESIGLSLNRIGLAENVPTLIGTLSLPGTSGTIFLIVTVKPVD